MKWRVAGKRDKCKQNNYFVLLSCGTGLDMKAEWHTYITALRICGYEAQKQQRVMVNGAIPMW